MRRLLRRSEQSVQSRSEFRESSPRSPLLEPLAPTGQRTLQHFRQRDQKTNQNVGVGVIAKILKIDERDGLPMFSRALVDIEEEHRLSDSTPTHHEVIPVRADLF